jgi:outer membrane protein OmpA-like peptidoglycan-associated protein
MYAIANTVHNFWNPNFWSPLNLMAQLLVVLILTSTSGCLATRGWVDERIAPLDGRVGAVEGRVADVDARLNQTNARVDEVAMRLDNLHLERSFVLNLKEGTTFHTNAHALTPDVKSQIDGFLTDLQYTNGLIFLVAGHTDNVGPENYNYELGQKRATSVARYLIAQRGIDPTRVSAVSYGETVPAMENTSDMGRRHNRRVDIFVYKEELSSSPQAEQRAAR